MAATQIFAAGGIVLRGTEPLIAIAQLRKSGNWVLPKGKLDSGESFLDAARREVLEETGCLVTVHEFVGTLAYDVGRKAKVVQFWRMQTSAEPPRKLIREVKAVDWLPLAEAVERLTHPREQIFLAHAGPAALANARLAAGASTAPSEMATRTARESVEDANKVAAQHPVARALDWLRSLMARDEERD